MNDLTPTQNVPAARPTAPDLTRELTSLLDSDSSPDAAARAIASSPVLLAEARAALPALQAVATARAGEDGVYAVVKRRFQIYPQPERSVADAALWWSDYYDALADVSLASLEAGMRAHVADPASEFMPKPGRLRELAFTAPCRSLGRFYRARRAIAMAEEVPAISGPRVDPGDVKAMLAEFEAKSIPTTTAKPRPYIGGIPDEGGITREMRELIAKRAAEALR